MNTKYILPILAFGALATACSDEPSVSPQTDDATYINFGVPTATVETRATEALPEGVTQGSELLNSLAPNTSFGVLGCCLAYLPGTQDLDYTSGTSPWSVKRPNVNLDVFNEQKVDFNGTYCSYTYGSENAPRKWYSAADGNSGSDADLFQYTFFSYYPYDKFEVLTRKYQLKNGTTVDIPAPIFKYSMPFNSTDENTILAQSDVKDVMLDAVYNVKKGAKVQFDFTHMLTALSFTVNNYSDNTQLTVYNIELSGEFWKSVTVDLTQASASYTFADSYKGRFVIYDNNNTGMDIPANNPDFTPAFANQYMLLISGKEDGLGYLGNATVSITYKFGDGEVKTQTFTRPATFVPRPGTMYQAQLNFVGNAFVIQFVTANSDYWEDGSDSDITFE